MGATRKAYDCTRCYAYCCTIYERVAVTNRDLARLAKHFGMSLEACEKRYTKRVDGERVLRRRKDELLGTSCQFVDPTTRGCTIYDARPTICRTYPGTSRCAYYEVLKFERRVQEDKKVLPLFQLSFDAPDDAPPARPAARNRNS